MKKTITIHGTHCTSCKALIEDVASEIPGIQSCSVNYETGETVIEHDPSVNWETVKKEIEALGTYNVSL